jgi:hypothetical protein
MLGVGILAEYSGYLRQLNEEKIRVTDVLNAELGEHVDDPVAVSEFEADLPLGYVQGLVCLIQQLQRYG